MYEHNRGFQSNEGVVATTANTTRSKSVIGQSSRRENIKRSYSLASKERRHKKFADSLKARSYRPSFERLRHQETAPRQDIRGSESTVM
jgi:hypothetical protein